MSETQNIERFARYRESIRLLAMHPPVNFEFNNSSAKHAAVVLANILETCSEVSIYDTHLEGDIGYQHVDFISALKRFLDDDKKKLNIVIRDFADVENAKLYKTIVSYKGKNENVNIRLGSTDFIDRVQDYASTLKDESGPVSDVNFAVGDNRAYRLEIYNNGGDRFHHATCNFNNPEKAQVLNQVFKEKFDTCSVVSV
jgi:predicted DNA binding CopG/RHH family protein